MKPTVPDPLTPAAERVLANVIADWDMDPHGEYDRARAELVADLAAIQSEARASARAESDALRAAHVPAMESDMDIGWAALTCSCGGWSDDESWWDHISRAALAPSPAEPAAHVTPCPDGDNCPDARRYGKVHPSPAEPAAPERCAFQRDGLEPCLLDRDNPRHTGCAHNPPRFLHGQQMACHDFRPAAPEREP